MPRESVAEFQIDRVQALSPDGTVDEAVAPDLDDEEAFAMYELMKWARALDRKAIALQRRGDIGTYAPAIGQEAAQVGSALALREADWMVPSFREQPAFLARGTPVETILAYAAGFEEGAEIPEDANDLPPSIAVGSQVSHAAGIGWGQALRDEEAATLVYFGDGATSEGDSYEGMNFAGVFDAHAVFLCQNNQYAISTPRFRQTDAETLAQKAVAAGIDAVQVDGNDALGVRAVAEEALASARRGEPVMIEALTFRQSMHTTADDPTRYRSEEEVEDWVERDPIDRYERYLRERGAVDDERVSSLEARIDDAVDEAFAGVEDLRREHDPADMFRYVFAEMTPELEDQLAAFREANRGD